jgi:hypothetical protein
VSGQRVREEVILKKRHPDGQKSKASTGSEENAVVVDDDG